jgi:hypothetical protein
MFLIQKEEWYQRAKEEATDYFINKSLSAIYRERRKNEKLQPGQVRDWSLGKSKSWPRQQQIEYINQYKHLIKQYKNISEYFKEKARLFHKYICLYEIIKGFAIVKKHKIRFKVKLNSRHYIPDGEYFLYKSGPPGYKITRFCVFAKEKPKNFNSPHSSGFFNFMGIANRRYNHNKIGRALVSSNKIVWLELRTCWEDNFIWL